MWVMKMVKTYRLDFPVLIQEDEPVKLLSVTVNVDKRFAQNFGDFPKDYAQQVHDMYALIDSLENIVHQLMLSMSSKVKVTEIKNDG